MLRALVPWTNRLPRPLESFENEFTGLMEKFFGAEEGWNGGMEKFIPRSNLTETEKGFEITVELPGMKPEEFNIEFKDGELWITGEKKEEKEEKGKTFHRVERRYGEFRRVFTLPSAVKEENVEANYKEGVLHVTVPKAELAKPKRIAVKA
jgi:HSP20 family protein